LSLEISTEWKVGALLGVDVVDVDRPTLKHGPAWDRAANEVPPLLSDLALRHRTVPGHDSGHVTLVDAIDHRIVRAAHAGGVLGDRIEHWLELRR
jgi:hypothetical protein